MNITTIENKTINEAVHIYKHECGFKAFCIPKKGYSKKYITLAVNYGSSINSFILEGEKDLMETPDGLAHFLEHKMFEQEDGNLMEKISNMGSTSNAYTTFNYTAYLLSFTEKLNENIKVLSKLIQNPYFTDENVEKEKKIIAQEIKMYNDNANWKMFFNLMDALYKNNTVKTNITGTIGSISKINKEMLYKCHSVFYHPSNMIILVVGDLDYREVFEIIKKSIRFSSVSHDYKHITPEEPESVNKRYIEEKFDIATSLFQIGFKDNNFDGKGIEAIRQEIGVKILLEMIYGKSSKFCNNNYKEGLINSSFNFDYFIEHNYAFSYLGGESPNPDLVIEKIIKELNRVKKNGLNCDNFERVKRGLYGEFIKTFNCIEKISQMFISSYFKDVNIFDYLDVYRDISFKNVIDFLENKLTLENIAFSIVKPF